MDDEIRTPLDRAKRQAELIQLRRRLTQIAELLAVPVSDFYEPADDPATEDGGAESEADDRGQA